MANLLLDKAWAVPADELDGVAKSVLANLCDRADDHGEGLRMSVAAVARETCWDRVTAQKALQRLQDHKRQFLLRRGTGRKGIVHYAINVEALIWERWSRQTHPPNEVSNGSTNEVPVAERIMCSPTQQRPVADDNSDLLRNATQTVTEPVLNQISIGLQEAKRFYEHFAVAYNKHRGAPYAGRNQRHDVSTIAGLLKRDAADERGFEFDRLAAMAELMLTVTEADEHWIPTTDRSIEILARKANWLEGRLRARSARTQKLTCSLCRIQPPRQGNADGMCLGCSYKSQSGAAA